MARNAIFLVLFFAVLGSAYFGWKNSEQIQASHETPETLETKDESVTEQSAIAVHATRTIEAGEQFTPSNIKAVAISFEKLPQDAFTLPEALMERRAATRIEKGSLISAPDLLAEDYSKWTAWDQKREDSLKRALASGKGVAVYAIKDIPEGKNIYSMQLEGKQLDPAKVPEGTMNSIKAIHGRKSPYGINQGQIITEYDLQPR